MDLLLLMTFLVSPDTYSLFSSVFKVYGWVGKGIRSVKVLLQHFAKVHSVPLSHSWCRGGIFCRKLHRHLGSFEIWRLGDICRWAWSWVGYCSNRCSNVTSAPLPCGQSPGAQCSVARPPAVERPVYSCATVTHWLLVHSSGQPQCEYWLSVNTRWTSVCGSLSYLASAISCWCLRVFHGCFI